ncbi:carbohydrate ABC transporter permease [Nocardiopsis composta]|uniref:Multiple sugar transport system permease protein n=1 Tax=Nocardiopsis composta TaxID=157465 RepID=A0A7W8QI92_9ACTN|nr:carbohydrate ABC transporter permease [Nocardiopsis composta]MBB5430215.1 multiple sugar transport system permease protein [Nocardiopsis composta]
MSTRSGRAAARGLQYLALCGYLVFLGFPLVWLVSTAFKTPQEMALLDPTWIPGAPTVQNFAAAFGEQDLVGAAQRSLVVALASAALVVAIALPAAYALARYRSRVNSAALGWVLVSQVFPFILVIIPLFMVLRAMGLVNTLPGLVIVHVTFCLPFVLWMLQGYVRGVPRVLEEAAAVDGAGRWRTVLSVIAPLLAPGVAASLMFGFVSSWNEFLFALILLKDPEIQTLPLALVRFTGPEGVVRLGPLAAASVLATLPSLLFFSFIQRRLKGGAVTGAVKG